LDLITSAHAFSTEDALIHIQSEEGIALVKRIRTSYPLETTFSREDVSGYLLQVASLIGSAGEAITVAVGHEEFHQGATHAIDEGRGGPHHHSFLRLSGAGCREPGPPLYLHEAEATAAIRLQIIIGTEGRDIDACALRRLKQRHPFLGLYLSSIYP
jgi:hypothetical protein